MNLALWLRDAGRVHGTRAAVAQGQEVLWTYAQFAEGAARTAAAWQARGISPGERVALFMANAPGYLLAMWSAWWAGAVVVPINARLHGREAAWILGHSGAKACVVDPAHREALQPFAPEGVTLIDGAPAADGHAPVAEPAQRDESDAAWLFYTSGTTGQPKGVTLTHRNLRWASMAYVATVQAVAPGDACLHPGPLSHGSGLYHLPYVMNAGVNVIPRSASFDEGEVFALASRWRHASFFAAPTLVNRLAAHAREHRPPLDGLATIVYGGAPMYVADFEAAREALGPHLAQIYGQGESPMTISVLPKAVIEDCGHPRWRERVASVGHAQPMVEVSIRDEAGRALPPGGVGEVCVRGEVVMAGYWNQPEATAAAIRDGWLWTGDVGRMDEDGFLTLLDRSKDLVICGGHNVYPREIEEVLLQHPAVAEVGVVGRRDAQWGEALVAWVVLRAQAPGGAAGDDASARQAITEALQAHCLDHLARYKRPKDWHFVDALPKNAYGKVLKTELRQREQGAPQENGS